MHLLVSARRNATPRKTEPARRCRMPRAPPRSSAGIQAWGVIYRWASCLPRSRKRENPPPPADGELLYARKKKNAYCAYACILSGEGASVFIPACRSSSGVSSGKREEARRMPGWLLYPQRQEVVQFVHRTQRFGLWLLTSLLPGININCARSSR